MLAVGNPFGLGGTAGELVFRRWLNYDLRQPEGDSMNRYLLAVIAASLCAPALSGCASIVKGSSQSVAISTPPVSGADCVLSSKEGNWTVVSPGVVHVQKSKEDIQIRCTKVGYQDAVSNIPSNFQGWTVGNILLGGVIGLGVDAATGAINEYPNAFQVPMFPSAAPAAAMPADTSTITTSGKPNS